MKRHADRPPALADHRQAHGEDCLGPELGGDPRRRVRQAQQGSKLRRHSEGDLRPVREHLHDVPAAPVRALPESGVRGELPFGLDLQARGGRHRADRPGQVPRLAHVRVRLSVQEDLLQLEERQGGEVHLLLPAHRSRPADGLCRKPASAASATSACCCTTPTASRRPPASSTTATCTRRSSTSFSIRTTRRSSSRRAATAFPTAGWKRRATAPVYKMAVRLEGGTAAAPGIPHAADGLVRATAVADQRRCQCAASWARNGEIPDVNELRIPVQVSGQPADRR